MSNLPIQEGRTSSDTAGNAWIPDVKMVWTWNRENLDAQRTSKKTDTSAQHVLAIKKPGN